MANEKFTMGKGTKKIYERESYIVIQVGREYILYNIDKDFLEGHTHLKSFKMAKTIINNCINKKKPKTDSMYILGSHIRVSNDEDYIIYIADLIDTKKNKGLKHYYNAKGRRLR